MAMELSIKMLYSAMLVFTLAFATLGVSGAVSTYYGADSVYWTESLDNELSLRTPFSVRDGQQFASKARNEIVVSLQTGCGRPKNLLATFSDGTKVCCRYRDRQWRELRGDLYAYHLNGYLDMWNVPPTILIPVYFSSKQWEKVAVTARNAGWQDNSVVAMSLFIDDLGEEFIPEVLRIQDGTNTTLTRSGLSETTPSDSTLFRLMQWSDMIVFDFIIGHTDRLFNTLFNYQWNKGMMGKAVHNLEKTKSEQLVLIDNESAFWMGYQMGKTDHVKYELQVQFLKRLCIYRKSTIHRIKSLANNAQSGDVHLEQFIQSSDPNSYKLVESQLESFQGKEFRSRLSLVLERIKECSSEH